MPNLQDLALSPSGLYALFGFLPIVVFLLVTGGARLTAIHPGIGHAGCPDERVFKDALVFGGASAYTFGWPYLLLAWIITTSNPVGYFFLTYGILQLGLSIVQTITYLLQVPFIRSNPNAVPLKAHLQGCGYTTSWSPFWPLYWLGIVTKWEWVVGVRDILTLIDYVVSLPATLILSVVTKVLFGKWTNPVVRPVDIQKAH